MRETSAVLFPSRTGPAVTESRQRQLRWSWLLFPLSFALPLVAYGWELRETSHYQFAWLFVPAALAFLPSRLGSVSTWHPGTVAGIWYWWGTAALLAIAGIVLAMPWFGAIGSLFWLAGAAYAIGGLPTLKATAPIWFCLWLTIRPPFDLDLYLIRELQAITAALADRLLDGFEQVHLRTGNVIIVPGKRLFVEEACSGVQSLFAGWACASLLCLARGHGILRWSILITLTPFWAIVTNALRVVIITLFWTERQVSIDIGFWHEALGLALFLLTAGFIASTDALLYLCDPRSSWRPALKSELSGKKGPQPKGALLSIATSLGSRNTTWCGFGLLGLQLLFFVAGDRLLGDGKAFVTLPEFGATVIPQQVGAWRQTAYKTVHRPNTSGEGTHGQQWIYQGPEGIAIVAIDYPFAGWHELSICYPAEGWELCGRNVATAAAPQASDTTVITAAEYRNDAEGKLGNLVFDLFDVKGKPVYRSGDPLSFSARLRRRMGRWQDRVWGPQATIQLQVFVETAVTDSAVSSAEYAAGALRRRRSTEELFYAVRAPLTNACVAALQGGGK